MKEELHRIGVEKVDGIVLDLGVSSFQLDTPERGFTYRDEQAPLDMRMDDRQSRTAKDIVNGYSEMELYRIIRDYGEDKVREEYRKAHRGGSVYKADRDDRGADGDYPGFHTDESTGDRRTSGERSLPRPN